MLWDDESVARLDSNALAAVLLRHWDVLAVAESDERPEGEYLFEATEVLRLLEGGADDGAVAAYLEKAAVGLGAPADSDRDAAAATALLAAYES